LCVSLELVRRVAVAEDDGEEVAHVQVGPPSIRQLESRVSSCARQPRQGDGSYVGRVRQRDYGPEDIDRNSSQHVGNVHTLQGIACGHRVTPRAVGSARNAARSRPLLWIDRGENRRIRYLEARESETEPKHLFNYTIENRRR